MKAKTIQISSTRLGKLTGVFYFQIIAAGLAGSLFFRGFLLEPTDPMQTMENLLAAQFYYQLGFLSDLLMVIADVVVSILFFYLLRHVNTTLALFAMVFRLIQSSILGVNLLNLFSPILILKGHQAAATKAHEIVYALELFDHGYLISGVFFGINCLLMGYLIYHSEFIPKWLGVMIALASVGYLANCLANFILPGFIPASEIIMFFTAVVAEVSLCFYLLIKGAKKNQPLELA